MEAQELYFMQNVNQVFRNMYYFTGNLKDATDVTRRTFSVLFRKWNQIEQMNNFETYTLSLAHLMASKQVHKNRVKSEQSKQNVSKQMNRTSTYGIPVPVEITLPEDIEYLFDAQRLLLPFLVEVTLNIRSILILCGIEGFSIEKVSKLLGYTKKRTSSLWQQGVQTLQAQVQKQLSNNQNTNQADDTFQLPESDEYDEEVETGSVLKVEHITEEWITQELSRFPRFGVTQWEKEELYSSTCRIIRGIKKRRMGRLAMVSVGVILAVSTLSFGEWKYGWVTRISQNVVFSLEGIVPNLVPEQTKVDQNAKSEIVVDKDVIHGGSNSADAVGALHETVKSAPFNVYCVTSAMQQQDHGGMYLTETRYDKKKQTLDLDYRLGDKLIHVWEAPSSQIKDRYKNLGEQQRFAARPWYLRSIGGQTVYSTVFNGTMIEFQTESLADSTQILDGLYSPSNYRVFFGKSTHWDVHCTLQKNEDPVDTFTQYISIVYSGQRDGQKIGQAYPANIGSISVQLQGTAIHPYELKNVSFLPGSTAYSDSLQYHQTDFPLANDWIRVRVQWQGKTESIDLKSLPQDVLF